MQWRKMDVIYNQYAESQNLTVNLIDTIDVIHDKQPCPQKDIQDALLLPKQTVSFLVKKLEKTGIVQMVQGEEDRRQRLVSLTKDGKKRAERIIRDFVGREEAAMDVLSGKEQKEMNALLTRFVTGLEGTMIGENDETAERWECHAGSRIRRNDLQ